MIKVPSMKLTLRDLRTFKHRINPEERQGAYGLYFVRPFSLYLTYLALRTGISANVITALQTLVGLIGAAMLAFPQTSHQIAGILLLQLGFVLDNVDGEVARYRNEVSLTGKYLDLLGHEYVVPAIFFCTGIGIFLRHGSFESVVFGFLAGMASLRLDVTNMYHEAARMVESNQSRTFEYYSTITASPSPELSVYRQKNQESWQRMIYACFAYPALMNILSILILAELVWGDVIAETIGFSSVLAFLVIYGTFVPIRRVYTIWRIVREREVEKKYVALMEAGVKRNK
jgi:phosphatidylglycerophosphate synthase